jgi:hypothetical protein
VALSWDNIDGLIVTLQKAIDSEKPDLTPFNPTKVKVAFGFPPFAKKISEFKNILEEASVKNIQIESLDFNYTGKALLKIIDAKKGTKNIQ